MLAMVLMQVAITPPPPPVIEEGWHLVLPNSSTHSLTYDCRLTGPISATF